MFMHVYYDELLSVFSSVYPFRLRMGGSVLKRPVCSNDTVQVKENLSVVLETTLFTFIFFIQTNHIRFVPLRGLASM